MAIDFESLQSNQISLAPNELDVFETDHALDIVANVHEIELPSPNQNLDLVGASFDFHTWEARDPLKRLMQPKGFIGPVADIILTPLPDPYDMLLNSKQRAVQRSAVGRRFAVTPQSNPINEFLLRELTVGFALDYTIQVRGKGGHAVRSEVYLAPVPFRFDTDVCGKVSRQLQFVEAFGGLSVARVVMQPVASDLAYRRAGEAFEGQGTRMTDSRRANPNGFRSIRDHA